MTRLPIKFANVLLGLCMVAAAGATVAITPHHHLADDGPRVNLETLIPKQFGDWKLDESARFQQVSPEVQAALDKIYTQVLTRNYYNSRGYLIMLSVPYGADQSDALSAHDPEGCYPAQGLQIMSKQREVLHTGEGDLPLRRMETKGLWAEPVTYWFTVGQYAVNNEWDRKEAKLRYAAKGEIPDGLLVRVSSRDSDTPQAYRMQGKFIEDLLKSVPPETRRRLAGL